MSGKFLLRTLFLFVLLAGWSMTSKAQCPGAEAKMDITEGCEPTLLKISLSGTPTYDSAEFIWGDLTTTIIGSAKKTQEHTYVKRGTYSPYVLLKKKDGTVICTLQVQSNLKVYGNPFADIGFLNDSIQCFKGNRFCMKDASKKSLDNANLTDWFWEFGDGQTSLKQNPCVSYKQPGTYNLFIRVKDANGCTDTFSLNEKGFQIIVQPKLEPNFATQYSVKCPVTPVFFNNKTTPDNIKSFTWYFTEGVGDTIQKYTFAPGPGETVKDDTMGFWDNFTMKYRKDGVWDPKLVVVGQYGCKDSFTFVAGAKNINYAFKITVKPDSVICNEDPTVQYFHPKRPDAYYHLWVFDDPPSGPQNIDDEAWDPSHRFVSGPGQYNVYLQIREPGCIRDTTYVNIANIKGPSASIKSLPPPFLPPNVCVEPEDFPPVTLDEFLRIQREGCNDYNTGITYVELAKRKKPVLKRSDTVWMYDKNFNLVVDTIFQIWDYDSIAAGPEDFLYGDNVTPQLKKDLVGGFIYRYDANTMSAAAPCNYVTLHDTDEFEPNCSAPNWVHFTNNTIKYRFLPDFTYSPDSNYRPWVYFVDTLGNLDSMQTPVDSAKLEIYGATDTTYEVVYPAWDYYIRYKLDNSGNLVFADTVFADKNRFKTQIWNTGVSDLNNFKVRLFDGNPGTPIFPAPENASDNVPPGMNPGYYFSKAARGWNSSINPAVPWASKDLVYTWSFGDSVGDQCTTWTEAGSRMVGPGGQDSAKCNFSRARIPWHRYDVSGCYSVTLRVNDPVNQCASTSSATIMMMEPNADWQREFLIHSRKVTTLVGLADSVFVDSLLRARNEPIFSSIIKKSVRVSVNNNAVDTNNYEIVEADNGFAYLKWASGKKPGNTFANLEIKFKAKKAMILFGDTLEVNRMTYLLQELLGPYRTIPGSNGKDSVVSPRRGLRIMGSSCATTGPVRYNQRVNVNETLPAAICGSVGKSWGLITDDKDPNLLNGMVSCTDTFYLDLDGDGIKETKKVENKQVQTYRWIPNSPVIEMGMGYPFIQPYTFLYQTGGCKTVGLWIRNNETGCVDTAWYENYKYIHALDVKLDDLGEYNDNIINNHMCLPDRGLRADTIIAMAKNKNQDGIVKYEFQNMILFPKSNFLHVDSLSEIKDTIYTFCRDFEIIFNQFSGKFDTTWLECINFPLPKEEIECGNDVMKNLSIKELKKNMYVADVQYSLTLKDTAHIIFPRPGFYNLNIEMRNAAGCFQVSGGTNLLSVGNYTEFQADKISTQNDTVLCVDDTVYFWNENYAVNSDCGYPGQYNFPRYWTYDIPDCPNVRPTSELFVLEHNFFQYPQSIRDNNYGSGYKNNNDGTYDALTLDGWKTFIFESVYWDLNGDNYFETLWDPAKLEFHQDTDQDGTYETILYDGDIQANGYDFNQDGLKDSIPFWVYPKEGLFDVRMMTIDSNGCEQVTQKLGYINVTGVDARMDTLVGPGHCAPMPVKFNSVSLTRNNYRYTYDNAGNIIDSTKVDSVIKWQWTYYRVRQNAPDLKLRVDLLDSPTFVFRNNGEYRVELRAINTVGCVDSTDNPVYAPLDSLPKHLQFEIKGPQPFFRVVKGDSCTPYTVIFKDSSYNVSFWDFRWINSKGEIEAKPFTERPSDSLFRIKFNRPDTYYVQLLAGDSVWSPVLMDSFWCDATYPLSNLDTNSKNVYPGWTRVIVRPIDRAKFVILGDSIVCPGDPITFQNQSDPDYRYLRWEWGDGSDTFGTVSDLATIQHRYFTNANETYTVRLYPSGDSSQFICPDTAKLQVYTRTVEAKIDTLNSKQPVFTFVNNSIDGARYEWYFFRAKVDPSKDFKIQPHFEYNGQFPYQNTDKTEGLQFDYGNNKGVFSVCLVAFNEIACPDTSCIEIRNTFDTTFSRTNVFTPNNDGKNDYFMLELRGEVAWDLTIVNRWGEMMFEADHETFQLDCEVNKDAQGGIQSRYCKFWDGTKNNSGNVAPAGTYFYIFNYKLRDGQEAQQTGTVTLIR